MNSQVQINIALLFIPLLLTSVCLHRLSVCFERIDCIMSRKRKFTGGGKQSAEENVDLFYFW